MKLSNRTYFLLAFLLVMSIVFAGIGNAFQSREQRSAVEKLEFRSDDLYVSQTNIPLREIISQLSNGGEWSNFQRQNPGSVTFIDPRSGRASAIVTAIPFIPGTGINNNLTLQDIATRLGYQVQEIGPKEIQLLVADFMQHNSVLLNINANEIQEIRVGHPIDYLWQVYVSRQVAGIPVRESNFTVTINHGNLILWGLEKWGDVKVSTQAEITAEQAVTNGFRFIASHPEKSSFIVKPHLELIPQSPVSWTGSAVGSGYGYYLAWAYTFRTDGNNTWEILVDAHNGKVISFHDLNSYALKKIVGAIYPVSDDECCPDGCAMPQSAMAFVDTGFSAPNDFTSINGLYNYASGTLTTFLGGKYTAISDYCSAPFGNSTTGDLDLGGTNGQHDCTLPPESSTTFAARSGQTELTQINRTARGWVSYPWLDTTLTANMNIALTCNAYWNGFTVNFYRSGGGCRNTGEIAAIFDHEWGHGVDDNDTNGIVSNPGESIADLIAIIRLHNSCAGRGFFSTANQGCGQWTICPSDPGTSYGYNCSGYGDCCTGCTGIRDSDYAKHASGIPHTPINFNCTHCSTDVGPCGKEVHCENAPVAEAGWDLAARDLQFAPFSLDKQTAFEITTRLLYAGSGNVTNWYACNCSAGTSDGCGANAGYMQWISADDDDGNISNGTPHMTAVFDAFDRHGIACGSPAPLNSGCSGAPTTSPVLSVLPLSNGASLTWSSVAGASQYYVFKNTGPTGCDFGKIKIATVSGTSYTDEAMDCSQNHYMVQPVGINPACLGPASNCISVTPPYPAPSGVVAAPTALNQVTVTWVSVPGAIGYNVYRKYTVCNKIIQTLVGSGISGTSYVDNTVSGGWGYQYSVATLTSCESTKSDWVPVFTTGECSLAPCFDGVISVVNNKTEPCGITISWNPGLANCTAYPNLHYTIYKSLDQGFIPGPSNQLATCVSGTSYVDNDVASGLTFYYAVRAEDDRTTNGGPCNGGNIDDNVVKKSESPTGPFTVLLNDDFEGTWPGLWTVSAHWNQTPNLYHSPTHSAHSGNFNSALCDALTQTSFVTIPNSGASKLYFWTRHQTEDGFDAGIVQGSSDGSTWTKLVLTPDYPGTTNTITPACLGTNPQSAFTGTNNTWTQYISNLAGYKGGFFMVRFNYATDSSVANGGWYVDDVKIDNASTCNNGSPGCTTPPVFSGLVSATPSYSSACQINLAWGSGTSTCPAGPTVKYNIYRSTNPAFMPSAANMIASCLTGTTYADSGVTYGTIYYYVVRAEDSTAGSSGPCNNGNADLNMVKKNAAPSGPMTIAFLDDFEAGLTNWTVSANWNWSTVLSHSSSHSAHSGNVDDQCDTLTLTSFLAPPAGVAIQLSFWTYYNTESGYDGGIVEASSDGTTWTKLDLTPGYPGSTNGTTLACIGTSAPCFIGLSSAWAQYNADLSTYAGSSLKVRYQFASDGSFNNGGWYIDDVKVQWNSSCSSSSSAPGTVHNTLTVIKSSGNLILNWSPPGGTCTVTAYGVYRGTLPISAYSHSSLACSVSGTSYTASPDTGNYYFLAVPQDSTTEGSYGKDSSGIERPAASSPCKSQNLTPC